MEIEKHIIALLYRYQCVIVPGFGAFLTEFQSAYYDDALKAFIPPTKRLSYNSNIYHNDGLLANHIAREEAISYDEAVDKIKATVKAWNTALTKEAVLSIAFLGIFNRVDENTDVFSPNDSNVLLKTSFGLSEIEATNIQREELLVPSTVAQLEPTVRRKVNYYKYAAVFAMAIGVGSILINNGYTAYVYDQQLSAEKTLQNKVQNKIQQATFVIEPKITALTLPVKEEVIEVVTTPFYIIASAYRNEEAARKIALELQEKGYENAVALGRTRYGMYPVAYGGYTTHEDAQNALRKIHKQSNKDAWILIK